MSYIRIRNFWEYQNSDAWTKALAAKKAQRRYPNWCKLSVKRDDEMDDLDVHTRLLFLELLRLATEHTNVIPNNAERIAKKISMDSERVAKGLEELAEGRWIQVTKSGRLSREFLEKIATRNRTVETEAELEKEPPSSPPIVNRHDAVERLLDALTDKDEGTRGVITALVLRYRLAEGDIHYAREEALMPGKRSRTGSAIAALKRRGEAKEAAA